MKLVTSALSDANFAINCEAVDIVASERLMAKLRGQGGLADFARCVEWERVHVLLKPRERRLYRALPGVDLTEATARNMLIVAGMQERGRSYCELYGITIVYQLARLADEGQREAFVADFPPERHTVAEVRERIDQLLGHERRARKEFPHAPYSQTVLAAGKLYLDPQTMTADDVYRHYEVLAGAFAQTLGAAGLQDDLSAARNYLLRVLPSAKAA